MFFVNGSYCYCIPDSFDGDFCFVNGVEYQVDFNYQGDAFITDSKGQTHIIVEHQMNFGQQFTLITYLKGYLL